VPGLRLSPRRAYRLRRRRARLTGAPRAGRAVVPGVRRALAACLVAGLVRGAVLGSVPGVRRALAACLVAGPAQGARGGPVPLARRRVSACAGQASVELLAILPLVVVVLAGAYQAVLAGEAVWQSRVAARAAARAHSLGEDPAAAARAHLPARLERGLRVKADASGDVRVSVRIPAVFPSAHVGRVGATSHFRPQT